MTTRYGVAASNFQRLRITAALFWYASALSLLVRGVLLLFRAANLDGGQAWPWIAVFLGILLGILKARFILCASCRKNLLRIAGLENPRWWQAYPPRLFAFLLIVIAAGITISHLVSGSYAGLCILGTIDLAVGAGLFASGITFFKVTTPSFHG